MLLRESTKTVYNKALQRFKKILYKAKEYKLLEENDNKYKFTPFSSGVLESLLKITTEKHGLVPEFSFQPDNSKQIIDRKVLKPENNQDYYKHIRNNVNNFSFTFEDFIHDKNGFEWQQLSKIAIDQSIFIFDNIQHLEPASTVSFYSFLPCETVNNNNIHNRVLFLNMNVYLLYNHQDDINLALQTFGYGRVVDWRHFLNAIDSVRYVNQNYSYRLGSHKIGNQAFVRISNPPFSPVLEKLFYFTRPFEDYTVGVLVSVCDINRLILCNIIQSFNDEDWQTNPAYGYFEFGPHSAPHKAIIHYFRNEEKSAALRLKLSFECIGIPVLLERKYIHPHEAIIEDSKRGFPFIVSIRPETQSTGIVGFYCSYTKITEMCDIRNVINQVHMYIFTEV